MRKLVIIGNVPLVDTLKSLVKNFEIEKTHKGALKQGNESLRMIHYST